MLPCDPVGRGEAGRTAAAAAEAKAAPIALASRPSESGAGVSVTRFWKKGSVDYKCVPALKGVDLEAYRKVSRLEVAPVLRILRLPGSSGVRAGRKIPPK